MSGGLVGSGLFGGGLLRGCSGCGGLCTVGKYGKGKGVVHYS